MNRYGEVVARSHKLLKAKTRDLLLKRLDVNEEKLIGVRGALIKNIRSGKTITPAAEWLLDNYYLIEEQIVIARKHLPKGYSEGLPCLAAGASCGMLRVYDIILEIISHSDGRVDIKSLSTFIAAYQKYTVLTLGELWAIPIMLRLAVIENLRRVSEKISEDMIANNLADYWAEKMIATVKENPADLILVVADMARSKPVLSGSFVATLIRELQGKGPALSLPLSWMEQQLSGMVVNSNDLVRQENQKQAADQVSIRNSIGTLRLLSATDWREFVENLSSVERVLRQDDIYPLMDFDTRDRYRHVVESISKASPFSETEVAQKAIDLTIKQSRSGHKEKRQEHVGFYLVDKGVTQTEEAAGMRYSLRQKLIRGAKRSPFVFYSGFIIFLTLAAASGMCFIAYKYGIRSSLLLILVGVLSVLCSSQMAVSIINWLSTIFVKPELLPRMDFSGHIPPEYSTLVVVPTMLTSKSYIDYLLEALEIRFLANRKANLYFGLLTDFADADTEITSEDDELLQLASNGIKLLNVKYKEQNNDIFFLFHRSRKWNAAEKKWMGYERKRGKISVLNALIMGKSYNDFSLVIGEYSIIKRVKYVITLDSDTQFPMDAAWKLIATMAHPLNQAVYNLKKKRVTEGYGILQPRIDSAVARVPVSRYLRMHGSVSGIDPYTRVSSDVYQDLFGEGSFIGKGIYDVDVFEKSVGNVFPENRILSHDLLEGCYSRSGLISDVFLYEDNPSQYITDVKRHHRWIRGDWQAGLWMMPFVVSADGHLILNHLSALSRWKIFDNLRRSLLPLSLFLFLVMGWSVLPLPLFWTLSLAVIILSPRLLAAFWQIMHKSADQTFGTHFFEAFILMGNQLFSFIFAVSVLPYEAFAYSGAAILSVWRMVVTRKKLLEWAPSASVSRDKSSSLAEIFYSMAIAPLTALFCTGFLLYVNSTILYIISPIIILWLLAPVMVWSVSKAEAEENTNLPEEQTLYLHRIARKTWYFFERFVTEEDNWLPPDNYQEQPVAAIAHRTSPTNMGLGLLANLTAYDFGYIPGGELVIRCYNTLQSMSKLERYKGHFYNWYDTLSLLPLHPMYVSTVDSGNLTAHLLTLRQGLLSVPDAPIFSAKVYCGIETTVRIMREFSDLETIRITKQMLAVLDSAKKDVSSLSGIKKNIDQLIFLADKISPAGEFRTDLGQWINRLFLQINTIYDDLTYILPWIDLLPVPAELAQIVGADNIPSLLSILTMTDILQEFEHSEHEINLSDGSDAKEWLIRMRAALAEGHSRASARISLLEELAEECEQMSDSDYDFLFDKTTNLLRIGYNVDEQKKDDSYYDMLASEARLGIFAGIALGKLPQKSWFALGRLLTNSAGDPILLSWSGSMFEYLMPQLVMPSYVNTLLYQTCKSTVKRQIEYAGQHKIPWGISESAYNMFDSNLNYQYRGFGVPRLGLKRGLEDDLVIAPYASMMALMISPAKACLNMQVLSREGFEGEYGFFESIDYTASRLPLGMTHSVIRSYMVHHQGIGFLSLAYLLLNKPMQKRFVSELRFQAALLLLQERIPRATFFYAHPAGLIETHAATKEAQIRKITTTTTSIPEIQLLSNGRYQVMITNSGGGYSRWKDIAVNRWREDATRDDRGIFCYIKDIKSGNFWSNTYQPTLKTPSDYEVIYSQGRVEFRRKDHGIDIKTEIVISPEDDIELRRVRVTNRSLSTRVMEITSYVEIVMASQSSDESHPAFSNLFVQTEVMPEHNAIFCTRRPRSALENPPWMFHLMDVHGVDVESISYETDRMRFIGRGKTLIHPQAMDTELLSGSDGSVLDPIMSIRCRIRLKPNETAVLDQVYGISDSKKSCEILMHKYQDRHLKNRAFELSWTHSHVMLRQINASEADAQLYNRLAASIIYANPNMRAQESVIINNLRGQSGLWSHSVSGDLPIVLLQVFTSENMELVKQMVQAHAYWRLKGLAVDLVIWNEDHGSYRQLLHDQILGLTTSRNAENPTHGTPGNIYVKSTDQLSAEDRILFESAARVIIHDTDGTLSEFVSKLYIEKVLPPLLETKSSEADEKLSSVFLPDDLLFFNGCGGFTPDGKEYKIITNRNETTPAPWVNVIANSEFGTVVSESGSAYTWAVNAHEYRITPWSNDPVSDEGGEAFYIRDEETGHFWSPSLFPAKGVTPYITTHGFGYTSFEHVEEGISSRMCVSVDKVLPVKFVVLNIKNDSGYERKLSITGFLEIILGDVRSKTNMHIVSEMDVDSGALILKNRYNSAFADRVAFFKVDMPYQSFTTDRSEFIGRNRNTADPQAMYRKKLSGRSGAGIDPCAALRVKFNLLDGAEKEIVFQIGNEENHATASSLIEKLAEKEMAISSLNGVKEYWETVLGSVQVNTPDPSLNIMANGWLLYQTLACRIFARSGFYQSGGAFGFRDQLQDVLALLHTRPEVAHDQILLNASRQFSEGDVQHWWHPPEGRGVRTHCSDDLLWLPFAVSKYISTTGDKTILDKPAGFLEGRLLNDNEDSLYDLPMRGNLNGTLYEHCVRAIKHSCNFGKHGLPLIGSGDWNDGMDQVGNKGLGESVWLAFFLYDVLLSFADVADAYSDNLFAEICANEAAVLRSNIDISGWDGQWYMRAYFDDGTPLGSKINDECRIDAIAQSWSVLSGAADEEKAIIAMSSLYKHLVKKDMKLIQLLDPPFDKNGPNPGYIRGYSPGIRENGGQYSHGAVWALMAFALLGDRVKVWELFSMINPLNHSSDSVSMKKYKIEPYVMAADVYASKSQEGMGGWSWYTGSSGWMYQFITGYLLGLQLQTNLLKFSPCFPMEWPSVSIVYCFGKSSYRITLFQIIDKDSWWEMDGKHGRGSVIELTDDGLEHEAAVHYCCAPDFKS